MPSEGPTRGVGGGGTAWTPVLGGEAKALEQNWLLGRGAGSRALGSAMGRGGKFAGAGV